MLKRLRIKFVVIIMVLVGTVLVSVLGGSFLSAWQSQHELTIEALEQGVEGSLYDMPRWGRVMNDLADENVLGANPDGEPPDREPTRTNILVLRIDLDSNGVVIATNDAPVVIDSSSLKTILESALSSDSDMYWDTDLHIAWMRKQRSEDAWRIVIADTSAQDVSLSTLAARDLMITAVAMVLLLAISLGLSTWVLRPVEQAWEQQRQFVADASHELKTPLAVIFANTQILMKDESVSDDARRWIELTAEESAHMKSLVEELLELARTDEGSQGNQNVMAHEACDFSSMVENAALEFDAVAYERGTMIEEDVAEGVTVMGDPEWLQRLAKILIENACKYSEPGKTIDVTLTREGKRCTLSVRNFGQVIEPEDLAHVFDRFYRTDRARSRDAKTGGFGLGLAIAKGIATSHGGDILCTSTEEEGTCFRVTLPIAG